MIGLSVITIHRNRPSHLQKLIAGLASGAAMPDELIIVEMSDDAVTLPALPFALRVLNHAQEHLPLAASRNIGAAAATRQHLLFLDVDCIPRHSLVATMNSALCETDALICPEVRYLGPDAADRHGDDALMALSAPHPVRSFPATGMRPEANAGLFWSLTFGIRRTTFDALGGFDIRYQGYGAEDTDFGFRARAQGVPLMMLGGTGSFHQYHGVVSPPVQHVSDIVANANLFHARWGVWPMDGWLDQFATMGLVSFDATGLRQLRTPTVDEVTAATQPPSVYF